MNHLKGPFLWAFDRGKDFGLKGKLKSDCPYSLRLRRSKDRPNWKIDNTFSRAFAEAWYEGWEEGHAEFLRSKAEKK